MFRKLETGVFDTATDYSPRGGIDMKCNKKFQWKKEKSFKVNKKKIQSSDTDYEQNGFFGMKTTTFIESKNNWLCLFCDNMNPHENIQCHGCDHIQGVAERIVRPKRKYTINQWKNFKQFLVTRMNGDDYYLDVQMQMVQKYDIILIDHINKRRIRKTCPTPLKETLKSIPSKITPENISKGFKVVDKGISVFNQAVQDFGKSMDLLTKEMSDDVKKGNRKSKAEAKKNKANINKLLGSSKRDSKIDRNFVKLWSDKPKRKYKTKRKPKRRSGRPRGNRHVEKLWGR